MSKLIDKLLYKILAIIIIILFIVAFRELIVTDKDTSIAFGTLMGLLPFAKVISDVVCKILKYQYSIPLITTSSFLTDLIRLAFMAFIQPLVVGLFTAIFLRIPSSYTDYHDREKYMETFGYRVKELMLTVLTAPILAIIASWFSTWLFSYFANTFGDVVSVILGILSVIILGTVSIIPLLIGGVAVGTAILWRIIVTLLSKMGTTFITNAMCLWVYIAILHGVEGEIATSIIALILWLFIMDFGMNCLKYAIVAK
ncbi:hypothetical protein B5E64_02425 [Drancourtella sp. An12]|uniref:hypothetical protein n=1 Tax=Drancourtella sp. An12 TaxID=1965548 RepID=UPI000B39DC8D|nr:hypothetical protein [Drancourtella sp. An12]OUQ46895.1 hypothetical protein B5E64_02425 [Drancourtella sp. An12]